MNNRETKIGGIVFGLIGFVLLFFAAWGLLHSANLIFYGAQTTGKVVDRIMKDRETRKYVDSKGRVFPGRGVLVAYVTADGKNHEFVTAISSYDTEAMYKGDRYDVGDTVPVLYLPKSPDVAELNLFDRLWFNPLFVGVFGLIFLGAGALIYFILGKMRF